MKKRTAAVAAILACTMMFSGCSDSILSSSGTDSTTSTENIWTASDDDVVAWTTVDSLSDEEKDYYKIKFKDFYSEYSFTITNYGLDETNTAYSAYAQYYRKNIIDMLTNEKLILKKAEELGLDTLSEDEIKEVETTYQKNLNDWYASFETKAKDALGISTSDTSETQDDATEEKILEKEKELFNEYISGFGLSEETFLKWQTNTAIQKKVNDYLIKDITVADSEVDDYITKLIAEAKSAYEKSVSDYANDSEYQKVWVPDDARRIKYIVVSIPSSDYAEINAKRNESGADDAEIDKLRDEKLAEIKSKAETALAKATADGADFDAVIKEYSSAYSEDTAGQTTLVLNNKDGLSEALYNGVFGLENPGDVSGLIATDGGYYIVKYESKATVSDSDINEYKKTVKEELLTSRQSDATNNAIEEWRNAVGYEYDYDKLNITKEEDTSSDSSESSDSSADSKADSETSSETSSDTTTSE